MTEWFNVDTGLKQGCILSSVMFNIYINTLIDDINALDIGINIDDEKIAILLYADDMVLMAENENDLQKMLDILNNWCITNGLNVNINKSKIMHCRNPSVPRTECNFTIGTNTMECVSNYQYLGLLLTEFLDYQLMAKAVAKSASRALGLLIVKSKTYGGFQHDIFSKLYNTMVWSVIDYGSCIWGTRDYSCINAVQNRAIRCFMGVGKYTPNDAIHGDMGWKPPSVKQWSSVFRHWKRCSIMTHDRINFKVFKWSIKKARGRIKNWSHRVIEMFKNHNFDNYCNYETDVLNKRIIVQLETIMFDKYKIEWSNRVSAYAQGNKLRTYKLFKHDYCTEPYLKYKMTLKFRSSFAKFRCGVAPLRIETGRYERKEIHERTRFYCNDSIEDELHVLLKCPLYEDLRHILFYEVSNFNVDFNILSDNEKLFFLFNDKVFDSVARTCYSILIRRNGFLYN
ncbi:uncharacterized protein [Mytilus edulis]|uniref:uncharacterized protein n=1 Tax=Mytilus edulis TaxID=6550 RepID=UPI0039EF784A